MSVNFKLAHFYDLSFNTHCIPSKASLDNSQLCGSMVSSSHMDSLGYTGLFGDSVLSV